MIHLFNVVLLHRITGNGLSIKKKRKRKVGQSLIFLLLNLKCRVALKMNKNKQTNKQTNKHLVDKLF